MMMKFRSSYFVLISWLALAFAWQPLVPRRDFSAMLRSATSETDEVVENGDDETTPETISDTKEENDPRDALREKIAELENELRTKRTALERAKASVDDAGKNGLYRLAAQVETYKRNNRGSAERSTESRKAEAFRAFTPVLEGFEAAAEEIQPIDEAEIKMQSDFQELYRALMDKFALMGMESFSVEEGTVFNPELHQAVDTVVAENDDRSIVVQQLRPGYKLKSGAIIRPAKCIIARPKNEDNNQDDIDVDSDEEATG